MQESTAFKRREDSKKEGRKQVMSQNKNGNLTVIDWIRHVIMSWDKNWHKKNASAIKRTIAPGGLDGTLLSSSACYPIILCPELRQIILEFLEAWMDIV